MVKVITYGTFDLLHQGHVNLLKRAKALGDYLVVGVTSDTFDLERGKLNVRNNVLDRIEAVKATGLADKIIIEEYKGQKIDDIQKYGVDIFTVGSDWEGYFDYLNEFCKVVYLPRTEGVSSTILRAASQFVCKIGLVGSGRIARRFVKECSFVNGATPYSVFNPIEDEAEKFAQEYGLKEYYDKDYSKFLDSVDAVYVASPHLTHYSYTKQALQASKHVLCEIPFQLGVDNAKELYDLATEKGLMLMEASKTAFCPAFNHIVTLVKSGVIGEVVDVDTSFSKLVSEDNRILDSTQAGGAVTELAPIPLMAIVKVLGKDIKNVRFYSKMQNDVDIFTKGIVEYENATASIKLGLGVKTEGNLVISGTKGYVYVPAPWWLTSYFEVRYEDQNKNKKFFYTYDGDGLRYEIKTFLQCIMNKQVRTYHLSRSESVKIAEIIEYYREGNNLHLIK